MWPQVEDCPDVCNHYVFEKGDGVTNEWYRLMPSEGEDDAADGAPGWEQMRELDAALALRIIMLRELRTCSLGASIMKRP